MNISIKRYSKLNENILNNLLLLENKIFEKPLQKEFIQNELKNKKNLLILIAYDNSIPIGYKIGFEFYSSETYFSWSGGIINTYRRKGLAKKLILEQHFFAKNKGYSFVRTHTKNKYKEMLVLNILCGFEITGVYNKINEKNLGIILEKSL